MSNDRDTTTRLLRHDSNDRSMLGYALNIIKNCDGLYGSPVSDEDLRVLNYVDRYYYYYYYLYFYD